MAKSKYINVSRSFRTFIIRIVEVIKLVSKFFKVDIIKSKITTPRMRLVSLRAEIYLRLPANDRVASTTFAIQDFQPTAYTHTGHTIKLEESRDGSLQLNFHFLIILNLIILISRRGANF